MYGGSDQPPPRLRRAAQETPAPATVSEPQTPAAAVMSDTSVTVVIAIKQYTSIAAINA